MDWSKLNRLFTESKPEAPAPAPEAELGLPPSAAEPAPHEVPQRSPLPSSAELENSLLRVENQRLKLEIECLNHVSRWLDRNADMLELRRAPDAVLEARLSQLELELRETRAQYEELAERVHNLAGDPVDGDDEALAGEVAVSP